MNELLIPDERIASRILLIRNERVMLDIHLADLYGIETRALKQAVKRNMERFPADFMVELTENEVNTLVSQFVIPSKSYLGGAVPFAFTEKGVAMLSSVIKSRLAVEINIAIMRTFIVLRKALSNYGELLIWKDEIEKKFSEQDGQIMKVVEFLRQFEKVKKLELEQKNRPRIGFK
jgi:hypothetical protein